MNEGTDGFGVNAIPSIGSDDDENRRVSSADGAGLTTED
jgi:hypothetical protein